MQFKTYSELRAKVQRETDTEGEDFVVPEEILGWFNDALNEGEAHIHKLGLEDNYFLSTMSYSLVQDQKTLVMPTNIYANKIKALIYRQKNEVYEIKRMQGRFKFSLADELDVFSNSTSYFQYMILNDNPTDGPYIELFPKSEEVTTDSIKMWYFRNVNELVDDTDLVEIPEFYSFIVSYVKYKILNKEGSPMAEDAKAELDFERQLMIQTLEDMVPDMDNKIEMDVSIYEETT